MIAINETGLWTPEQPTIALEEPAFRSYRDQMVQPWGDWLSENYKWDLFVTLTFRDVEPLSEYQWTSDFSIKDENHEYRKQRLEAKGITNLTYGYAVGKFLKLIKKMKNRQGTAPYWVRATHGTGKWENLHFHALIGGVGSVDREELWTLWKKIAGLSKILKYDPSRGAAYYISKSHENLEFSKYLERHRLN